MDSDHARAMMSYAEGDTPMYPQHLIGRHVRLETLKSDADIEVMKKWTEHSTSWRMLDTVNVRSPLAKNVEPHHMNRPTQFFFRLYPLNAERPIGHAGLFGIQWAVGEAWLGIGLGSREYWAKQYGSDAIQVILSYGFTELDLRRVMIGVFDYDARAILSYEEAGFVIEGRMLQEAGRAGRSRAGVRMGLQREAWAG